MDNRVQQGNLDSSVSTMNCARKALPILIIRSTHMKNHIRAPIVLLIVVMMSLSGAFTQGQASTHDNNIQTLQRSDHASMQMNVVASEVLNAEVSDVLNVNAFELQSIAERTCVTEYQAQSPIYTLTIGHATALQRSDTQVKHRLTAQFTDRECPLRCYRC